MILFTLRRLLAGLVVLAVSSVVVFSLLHLAPGDPATVVAGPDASPQVVQSIRTELGLDRPLSVQYLSWARDLLSGDLGTSYTLKQPINDLVATRIGSTLQLAVTATLIMVVLGGLLGVVLAVGRPRVLREIVDQLATLMLAFPPFVSGVVLIFVFAVVFQVVPSGGDASLLEDPGSALSRLILPSIALALAGAPVVARLLATEMRRVADQEFVLTAIAKGASRRRITWRHVLPNSLAPAIIELGIRVGHLLGGAVVAEAIFARTGVGTLLVQAVETRDYPVAQALLLLGIGAAILVQLVAELCIAGVDPRVRMGVQR